MQLKYLIYSLQLEHLTSGCPWLDGIVTKRLLCVLQNWNWWT